MLNNYIENVIRNSGKRRRKRQSIKFKEEISNEKKLRLFSSSTKTSKDFIILKCIMKSCYYNEFYTFPESAVED
ncbi:hypothetical protein OSC52_08950 [Clostridium pasteurianum]|uniref:hypothetical protein n=1 Tax=Clostridium pasteurianum TaxID=1501 RepID=UPI002260FB03|nr:hypothetical protein [Clostridium pasteurianum]UZW15923.1 hypothetical protein OSC52_08950 [Clostridium pasteurianum]